jgi:hypothetical protein
LLLKHESGTETNANTNAYANTNTNTNTNADTNANTNADTNTRRCYADTVELLVYCHRCVVCANDERHANQL